MERFAKNAMQVNSPEDYIARLTGPQRRNPEAQPVLNAIAGQFQTDKDGMLLKPDDYKLVKEYGATKYYQVTEKNSKVIFDVNFYFYGGIISGWSVAPEKESFEKYRSVLKHK